MAIIPFTVAWMYQNREEILETRYDYYADEEIEADLSQSIARDLVNFMYGKRNNFRSILCENQKVWGVSVRSPLLAGVGPARSDVAMSLAGTYEDESLTDQITYRIYQRSHNVLNSPIQNSNEMSGLPAGAINCNLIDEQFIDVVNTSLEDWQPLTIALSSATVTLAVRHKPAATPVDWFDAEVVECANMVGSNLTRRGNRAQRGPDTKPPV